MIVCTSSIRSTVSTSPAAGATSLMRRGLHVLFERHVPDHGDALLGDLHADEAGERGPADGIAGRDRARRRRRRSTSTITVPRTKRFTLRRIGSARW